MPESEKATFFGRNETIIIYPDDGSDLPAPGIVEEETEAPMLGVPRENPVAHLEPRQILMLGYAHIFTTDHDHYAFWKHRYGITDMPTAIDELESQGFLQIGDRSVTLEAATNAQLKDVLRQHGLKVSGKKADLVERLLESVPADELDERFPERRYQLTDLGKVAVEENEYIQYVHSNRQDLDINVIAAVAAKNPGAQWRDLMWGYLNEKSTAHAAAKEWGFYRVMRFTMAEFLTEEHRWSDALGLMAEVVYIDLSGWNNNTPPTIMAEYIAPYDTSLLTLPPGVVQRLDEWAAKAGLDDDGLRSLMLERLRPVEAPFHFFTVEEVVRVALLEKAHDVEALSALYEKVAGRQ